MSDDSDLLPLIDNPTYYDEQPEPPEWILDPLLTEGSVMMLYGESGRGKTSILYQLAYAVASGTSWMGFPTKTAGKVLFLEIDMMDAETRRFMEKVRDEGLDHPNIRIPRRLTEDEKDAWASFNILRQEWCERLRATVNHYDPALVVVDTVEDAYRSNELTVRKVRQILDNLRQCVTPAALVFTRHTRKASKAWAEQKGDEDSAARGGFSGFSQWEDAPTATSVQIGKGNVREKEDDFGSEQNDEPDHFLKFHKLRLGDPGYRIVRVEPNERHFFSVDRDYHQLLANWPEWIDDGERQEAVADASSKSDVFRQVATKAQENPATVRRAYYRSKNRGTEFEWEALIGSNKS